MALGLSPLVAWPQPSGEQVTRSLAHGQDAVTSLCLFALLAPMAETPTHSHKIEYWMSIWSSRALSVKKYLMLRPLVCLDELHMCCPNVSR